MAATFLRWCWALIKMEKQIHSGVVQLAEKNMAEGMTRDKAYTEAMFTLGVIDFDEYSNIRRACQDKGSW